MKPIILAILVLSSVLGRAQTKDTDTMVPGRIYYLSNDNMYFAGINKSAVVLPPLTLKQRIEILELQNAALTRLFTETRSKLDSLVGEMKMGHVFKPGAYLSIGPYGVDVTDSTKNK